MSQDKTQKTLYYACFLNFHMCLDLGAGFAGVNCVTNFDFASTSSNIIRLLPRKTNVVKLVVL